MGACADMWQDEVDKVGEDFAFERITRDEGMRALRRLGFDAQEAADLLDEAVS